MIDIHNHVIFDFDDGPKSLRESLDMLRIAADQGITDVFATSHFTEIIQPEVEESYFSKLETLRAELGKADIPVTVHSGAELFFHAYLAETVKQHKVAWLGGESRYLLMEFPMYLMPSGVEETLFSLTLDGYIPIIAHPERYTSFFDKPEKLLDFARYGGLLQVNVGSVLGRFGRTVQRNCMWLLENRYVHFLASDAHGPNGRTFELDRAARHLEEHLDRDYIEDLVTNNARKIIDNEVLEKLTVAEPEPQLGFLQRMKERLGISRG